MAIDKVRLRNTLKKLRQIEFDRSDASNLAMTPQEMLDFLAMLAGLKPVYLLGRGFEDPTWIKGIIALAKDAKLHVFSGPRWEAGPEQDGLSDVYADILAEPPAKTTPVTYISKLRNVASELASITSGCSITIKQEARLLGYPLCCVRDHYYRGRMMKDAMHQMLLRTSGGSIPEMQRLIRYDVEMTPTTPEEVAGIQAATRLIWAPFTSFCMCLSCASTSNSPARLISNQFETLARLIDARLVAEIEQTV